jgi:hypothetical protein
MMTWLDSLGVQNINHVATKAIVVSQLRPQRLEELVTNMVYHRPELRTIVVETNLQTRL